LKNLADHLDDPRQTPPVQPMFGRENQMHVGPAGAYVFNTGDWDRLDRFLIIGSEGGTYYAGEKELTIEAAAIVRRCLAADAPRVIARIVEVSHSGLAPKNDAAVLALAIAFCAPGVAGRAEALRAVCRTGTHLFQFLQAVRGMRGGGRALNGAVRAWMNRMDTERLALQMVKYRNRAGWTWRDVMRRYRPRPPGPASEDRRRDALYAWAARKPCATADLPKIVTDTEIASTINIEDLAKHVDATGLPWECVPSEATTRKDVLGAILNHMPLMAMVRQLSKLQTYGVPTTTAIVRLRDESAIRDSRIHPVALMIAASAYETGSGKHLTWTPDPSVVDALDDAFQLALRTAEPTGKRILVAIDCSGSMHHASCGNMPLFKIAAAMALTYRRTDSATVIGFDTRVCPIAISERMRVTDAMRMVDRTPLGGGTDCGLPFKFALERDINVDAFVIFTDSESWAGNRHPAQALDAYRAHKNQGAKVIWCAMTAGDSSLGLPEDRSCLGIAGFDASAPMLVSNFIAGRI
jgi:60 kDa SS-A/Ro ribonucleoprotein